LIVLEKTNSSSLNVCSETTVRCWTCNCSSVHNSGVFAHLQVTIHKTVRLKGKNYWRLNVRSTFFFYNFFAKYFSRRHVRSKLRARCRQKLLLVIT
jgi:hypothetical protein